MHVAVIVLPHGNAVNGLRTELLQGVLDLTDLCVVAAQLGTDKARIEQVEHALASEAALFVVLVALV